jgi:hypothetical protein
MGVVETDPLPIASNNPFAWRFFVQYAGGGVYKDLDTCQKYITFKSALTMEDDDAEIAQNSDDNADVFTVVNLARGVLDLFVLGADIATYLVVGVVYYVDVTLIDADGEANTILYDTIRPYQVVTKGAPPEEPS